MAGADGAEYAAAPDAPIYDEEDQQHWQRAIQCGDGARAAGDAEAGEETSEMIVTI